jgi:hypothetical protein
MSKLKQLIALQASNLSVRAMGRARHGSSNSLNCSAFRSVPSAAEGCLEVRPNHTRDVRKMRQDGGMEALRRAPDVRRPDQRSVAQRQLLVQLLKEGAEGGRALRLGMANP